MLGLFNLWALTSSPRPRTKHVGGQPERRSRVTIREARFLLSAWARSKLGLIARITRWITAILAPLVLLLVGWMLYWQAIVSAEDARRGIAVHRPILPLVWGIEIPLLDVRALPVTVGAGEPHTSPSSLAAERGTPRCLLYLGEADGTSLLYEPGAHDLIRIPTNDVVLVLDVSPEEQVQERCRSA